MNKKETLWQELASLFDSLLGGGDSDALTDYLVAQSNLPGRRANIELARAFGDTVALRAPQDSKRLWKLCTQLTDVSPQEAQVNDPREFLPFCGAMGLGAVGAAAPDSFASALHKLHTLANDPRWRLREAVAFGLQRLLAANPQQTMAALQSWIYQASWLELRAAAAAVAEPTLLQEQALARSALDLHKRILERVQGAADRDRKAESFRKLRQGLGYTPSVVVQALPDKGFAWLAELAESHDRDVLWIVRQNLKKTRLVRRFPDQVERLVRRVTSET
jgi:hypothetical protein